MKDRPSADDIRELLDYDQSSGRFTWKVDRPPLRSGARAGFKDSRGRHVISVLGSRHYANRLAWLLVKGEWPRDVVRFRDGDRTNLKWSNLDG